jgi:hypothetical protein
LGSCSGVLAVVVEVGTLALRVAFADGAAPGEDEPPLGYVDPDAGGCIAAQPTRVAMQKVVGSSPIIRSEEPRKRGFFLP